MDTPSTFLTYWYFTLPNFLLAAIMYTLIGRVMLSLIFDEDTKNYIWRFFVRVTDPIIAIIALVTPKATAPVVLWLFGVVWMFWLRFVLYILFRSYDLIPQNVL